MERRSAFRRAWTPLSLALTLACVAAPRASAQTQDQSLYDGTWTVRLPCPSGGKCSARLVIADYAGTWQDTSGTPASKRICGGKKMPITVQSSTTALLAFTVFGDGESPTCPTLSVRVAPVAAKALEGTFESGKHAMESPEVHASHSMPPSSSAAVNAGRTELARAATTPTDPAKAIRLERR